MSEPLRTMGVDQVPAGLEISVVEWTEAGSRAPLLSGVLSEKSVQSVLTIAQLFGVSRGLVDPSPDQQFAMDLTSTAPEQFATHSGSEHNAASLAENAWRRMQVVRPLAAAGTLARRQVVSLESDLLDASSIVARVYVPSGEESPSHLVIDFSGADEMVRPDGSKIVEKVLPIHEAALVDAASVLPKVGFLRQLWSIAPTTTLPPQGWSLSLSVFANGVLVHEQVVTDPQIMGLMNVVAELGREAGEWIEKSSLPAGPYTAEWGVYAGPTNVHTEDTSSYAIPMVLAGVLHDAGVHVSDWISTNAVAMAQQYPWANLPEPGPYDLPPSTTADTFDTDR